MNTQLLKAIKEDILANTQSIRSDFNITSGHKQYLQDFFANNPQFDDSQESFDEHIHAVLFLFRTYIY